MNQEIKNELAEKAMNFEPIFDKDTLYRIEECCQLSAVGQHRRMLLGVLTMDSDSVFEFCENEPEAAFEVFKKSAPMVSEQKELADLLGKAHARLMVGLCGVDSDLSDAPFTQEEFSFAVDESRAFDDARAEQIAN